jgi:prevent-host-death family protein
MQYVQNVKTERERLLDMEKTLGVTKAREKFGDLVEQVQYQGDTYIINRNGKPAAAIVPIGVYENWKKERDAFFDIIRKSQQEANITPDEADRLAEEAVGETRSLSRKIP